MRCNKAVNRSNVDCDKGRELGCNSFCCRLLVRLDPDEREPSENGLPAKGFIDKDEQGNCIHHDLENSLCKIWERRPRVCRQYECNSDPLMQVVVRHGFKSLGHLVKTSASVFIPKEAHISIPLKGVDPEE